MSLPIEGFGIAFRNSRLTLIALILTASALGNTFAVSYDIVYVRQPRFGNNTNTTWPEVSHPGRIDPGADLMVLHPNGNEEVLVNAGTGSVTDPFVSFDGQWVYYSYFYEPGNINTERGLPYGGADIFKIHLGTKQVGCETQSKCGVQYCSHLSHPHQFEFWNFYSVG